MGTTTASARDVRTAALNLLARREYTAGELQRKLQQRFGNCEDIARVIENLAAENLQSDERFIEMFLSSRMRKGQGPVRIINELKERGIQEEMISRYVDPGDTQWLALAEKAWQKRFSTLFDTATSSAERSSTSVLEDRKARARQMRFLQYRGFTAEQINKILKS